MGRERKMRDATGALNGVSALEILAGGCSFIHRLHPLAKLFVTLVFITAVISRGRYAVSELWPFFFYPSVMVAASDLPLRPIFKRTLVAIPFVAFAAASNVFFDRETAFYAGNFGVSWGVICAASIFVKTFLTVSAVFILIATTPITDLCRELRLAGAPEIIVTQFLLMMRYLGVLAGEAHTMAEAYHLRSGGAKGVKMEDMGSFAGQLLLRGFGRAERIYMAMKCRGFEGGLTARGKLKLKKSDFCFLASMTAVCLLIRIFGGFRLA
jgi:cobalt/nickel transport system permease protein